MFTARAEERWGEKLRDGESDVELHKLIEVLVDALRLVREPANLVLQLHLPVSEKFEQMRSVVRVAAFCESTIDRRAKAEYRFVVPVLERVLRTRRLTRNLQYPNLF